MKCPSIETACERSDPEQGTHDRHNNDHNVTHAIVCGRRLVLLFLFFCLGFELGDRSNDRISRIPGVLGAAPASVGLLFECIDPCLERDNVHLACVDLCLRCLERLRLALEEYANGLVESNAGPVLREGDDVHRS